MPHHHGRSGTSMGVKQGPQKSTSTGGGDALHLKTKIKPKIKTTTNNLTLSERNALTYSKLPPMKNVPPSLRAVGNILDSFTGAAKKNWDFFFNPKNYERIAKNKNLPDLKTVAQMETADIQKLYRKTRLDIMRSNQNPFGETDPGGGDGKDRIVKKVVGGQTLLAQAPTEAEVSQSDATNAAETKLTKRRVKARGRKMNIYAQAKDKLILGKKSLLGYV